MIVKSISFVLMLLLASAGYAATGIELNQSGKGSSLGADRETLGCMQCHDGVLADDVELQLHGGGSGKAGLHLGKHPVGMDYGDYVKAAPVDYRPLASLSDRIQLVDGRVSCVSCHQTRQKGESIVAVKLNNTAENFCRVYSQINTGPGQMGLCQSCHIK